MKTQVFVIVFLALSALLPTSTGAVADVVSSPPTCFIDAQPRAIIEGAPVRLSWRTENATDVSISNIGPVSPNDFSIRYPSYGRADYALIARGENGVATCGVVVIIATHSTIATDSVATQSWFTAWFISPIASTWRYISEPVIEWFVEEEEYFDDDSLVPSRGIFNGKLFFEEEVIFERKDRSGFGEREMLKEIPWWQRIYDRVTDRYEETEDYYTSLLGYDSDTGEKNTNETREWENVLEEIYEEEEEAAPPKEGDSAFYVEEVKEGDTANNFNSNSYKEEELNYIGQDTVEEKEYVPPKGGDEEVPYVDEVLIYE